MGNGQPIAGKLIPRYQITQANDKTPVATKGHHFTTGLNE
jgi:hypothetical protein